MGNMTVLSLPWGGDVTFYAFLLALGALFAAVWVIYHAPRYDAGTGGAILYVLLAGVLGLFLGRAVYCGVRFTQLFYDPRGEFAGLAPFLDVTQGGVNVIGVLLGVLLAAPVAGVITRNKALNLLDAAAIPGMLLFCFARLVEPFSGMGFGDLVTDEALCFFPLTIEKGMGDHFLSVCFIEAVLAAIIFIALLILKHTCKKSGTLAGYALAMLCVTQIVPESLRLDDVLFLFIFARVSQLGYAALMAGTLIAALIRGGRRGLSGKVIVLEIVLLLLGIGALVAGEFALDKTNISNLIIYCVMIAVLLALGFMILRRIRKEDRINA